MVQRGPELSAVLASTNVLGGLHLKVYACELCSWHAKRITESSALSNTLLEISRFESQVYPLIHFAQLGYVNLFFFNVVGLQRFIQAVQFTIYPNKPLLFVLHRLYLALEYIHLSLKFRTL